MKMIYTDTYLCDNNKSLIFSKVTMLYISWRKEETKPVLKNLAPGTMEDCNIINIPWDNLEDAMNDQNCWKTLAGQCALQRR